MKVFVIRHSQTEWNKIGKLQGHLDCSLTDFGIKTAEKLADNLANKNITRIISSDLGRCVQTSEIVSKKLEIKNFETDKLLRERSFGDYNGQYKNELLKTFDWHSFEAIPPNGESLEIMKNRVIKFMENMIKNYDLKENDIVLLVVHHGVFKALNSYVNGNHFSEEINNTTQQTIGEFSLEENKLKLIDRYEI